MHDRSGMGTTGPEDRAPARRVVGVVGGHDVEVLAVGAAEAEARDERGGHVDANVESSLGREALDASAVDNGDPYASVLVDREAIRSESRSEHGEDAAVCYAASGVDIVQDDVPRGRVDVIERSEERRVGKECVSG